MKRRQVLGGMAAALAAPSVVQAQSKRVLKFVPDADLAVIDPVITTSYQTRDHGFMVFDSLYGQDDQYRIRPQMAEGHVMEDDGKTWTKPASIGFRGVEPAMLRMANGALALCTGRPDTIAVRFSTDDGESWGHATELTKGFEHPDSPRGRGQKSTCYTGLVEVEPGKLLAVYDHLPFVDGWGLNPADRPDAINTIYGTFLKVDR